LIRDGIDADIPVNVANDILRSYRSDPPTRYRVEFWLSLIAKMIYSALGGKGEMPTPPWWTKEEKKADIDAVVAGLKMLGIGVTMGDFTDAE
jgi:hypothetical protein